MSAINPTLKAKNSCQADPEADSEIASQEGPAPASNTSIWQTVSQRQQAG
jgi:hypothetical protein